MPRRQATRRPLSRDVVLREAISLADVDGLEAVSMRRLAERLGVVPMALYKHVADKEDLLDGVVETLLADLPRPDVDGRRGGALPSSRRSRAFGVCTGPILGCAGSWRVARCELRPFWRTWST